MKTLALILCLLASPAAAYDTAFLAAPRNAGFFRTQAANDGAGPYQHQKAALIVINDAGDERVLIETGAQDFSVSIDGKSLFVTLVENYPANAPAGGNWGTANIWKVEVATGERTKITNAAGNNQWRCQPVELPSGEIAYLSNEDGWRNPHEWYRAFVVYKARADGSRPERLGHFNFGGVFGLALAKNGRLLFASAENQGFRGGLGSNWGIWSINPDGGEFQPEFTAAGYNRAVVDFPASASDGSLLTAYYYDGSYYGAILRAPEILAEPFQAQSKFGSPAYWKNPLVANGFEPDGVRKMIVQWGWQRVGLQNLTPEHGENDGSWFVVRPDGTKDWVGKFSHPAPIPNNGMLVTCTGHEPNVGTSGPFPPTNLGVYRWPDVTKVMGHYSELAVVVDKPDRNEWWGRPIVPVSAIYGMTPPTPEGSVAKGLPPGSPYGVVESASVDEGEWYDFLSRYYNRKDEPIPTAKDTAAFLRVVGFNPTHDKRVPGVAKIKNGGQGTIALDSFEGFHSQLSERAGQYLPLIPLRKYLTPSGSIHYGPNPPEGSTRMMRADGRPDTSFRFEIPGNQCWTFQMLDDQRQAIRGSTAETWHSIIPAKIRNCTGCHDHKNPDDTPISQTAAGRSDYPRYRLKDLQFIVRERDLPEGVPSRPWDIANAPVRAYQSSLTQWDEQLAAQLGMNEAKLFDLRAWIDTGMLQAGTLFADGALITPESKLGPYADEMEPTVSPVFFTDKTFVGAVDPQSGVASVKFEAGGVDVTDQFTFDADEDIWAGPAMTGEFTATVTDGAGQVAKLTRDANGIEPAPEPDPEVEPDECEERLAVLQAEIELLKQDGTANAEKIAELQRKIAAAREDLE